MLFKRALITSLIVHAIALVFLGAGYSFSWLVPKHNLAPLEAKVIFKGKPRDKELLPRKKSPKIPAPEQAQKSLDKKEEVKVPIVPEAPKMAQAVVRVADKPVVKEATKVVKSKVDYTSELKKLSASFSEDLSKITKESAPEELSSEDSTYFDQIYALIKESFILPPHIDGPQGHKLQAVIRLFLSDDGNLSKLDLERSSGDEHFDKAVLDGAKRVSNFGKVPLLLQNALSEKGVVVELCPFKCME